MTPMLEELPDDNHPDELSHLLCFKMAGVQGEMEYIATLAGFVTKHAPDDDADTKWIVFGKRIRNIIVRLLTGTYQHKYWDAHEDVAEAFSEAGWYVFYGDAEVPFFQAWWERPEGAIVEGEEPQEVTE